MMSRLVLVLFSAACVAFPVTAQAARGDCGQPVTTGSGPTAADCLYILKTAVGAQTCIPECICDIGAPTESAPATL